MLAAPRFSHWVFARSSADPHGFNSRKGQSKYFGRHSRSLHKNGTFILAAFRDSVRASAFADTKCSRQSSVSLFWRERESLWLSFGSVVIVPGLRSADQQAGATDPKQWIKVLALEQDAVTKVELFQYPQDGTSEIPKLDAIDNWSQCLIDEFHKRLQQRDQNSRTQLILCCQGLGGGIIADSVSRRPAMTHERCLANGQAFRFARSSPVYWETLKKMISGVFYIGCPSHSKVLSNGALSDCLLRCAAIELGTRNKSLQPGQTSVHDIEAIVETLRIRADIALPFPCYTTFEEKTTLLISRPRLRLPKKETVTVNFKPCHLFRQRRTNPCCRF